jgi:hypothetical protein
MWLKALGFVVAAWIVLAILGAVFDFLVQALVVGAVVFLGVAAYRAVKGRSRGSIGS